MTYSLSLKYGGIKVMHFKITVVKGWQTFVSSAIILNVFSI